MSYSSDNMFESFESELKRDESDAVPGCTFEAVQDFKGLYTVFRFDYVKNIEETDDALDNYNAKKMIASRSLLKTLTDFDAMLEGVMGLGSVEVDLHEAPLPRERSGRGKKTAAAAALEAENANGEAIDDVVVSDVDGGESKSARAGRRVMSTVTMLELRVMMKYGAVRRNLAPSLDSSAEGEVQCPLQLTRLLQMQPLGSSVWLRTAGTR
jgi:hypothetical protein